MRKRLVKNGQIQIRSNHKSKEPQILMSIANFGHLKAIIKSSHRETQISEVTLVGNSVFVPYNYVCRAIFDPVDGPQKEIVTGKK